MLRIEHLQTTLSLAAACCALLGMPDAAVASGAGGKIEFNRDVRPILSGKCFQCHGPDAGKRKARLRLDTPGGATRERRGRRAVVAGSPERSELYLRITAEDPLDRMPPPESEKELSAAEIETLKRWIASGAEYQRHWSYVPPTRPKPPAVKDARWPRGAIDRFVLARLEAQGWKPAPAADKVTLARRLYFDILGLPPSPAEVAAFTASTAPDPVASLADHLLRSPRFGERMAMYWLDLVRYADTVGYHGDQEHNISPYRDYVIASFNANKPFDEFTIEQLAGDLLPNATVDQKIASGYNRLLQTTHEGGAQDKEYLAKYAADRVRNFSTTWMGATMGCAECHDHKYDPYTQKDFYSLVAFFADIKEKGSYAGSPNTSPTRRPPEIEVLSPLDRQELRRLNRRIADISRRIETATAGQSDLQEEVVALKKRRDAIASRKQKTMVTVAVKPRTIRLLPRGDWMDESGPVMSPQVPEFLPPLDAEGRPTRLDLARWLTAKDHPQTARIFVNRLWYLFFGEGLSRVLDDTGSQGEWPTHPGLLDYLAVEFVESGWDIKHMVKLIVTSSTYRQSSRTTPEQAARDPENRLLARQGRFRLPAEMIRDNALAVSGLLVNRLGGPSARPYQPAGYYAHLNFPKRKYRPDTGAAQFRRGVYMHWQRQFLHPMLKAFDAPSREECTARRPISNTPLAALTLLNDPTFVEAARAFAARILRQPGSDTGEMDTGDRLDWAWRVAVSRAPTPKEMQVLRRLLVDEKAFFQDNAGAAAALTAVGVSPKASELDVTELASWTSVARAILNLNETITRN